MSAPSSSAPAPSKHVFLYELPKQTPGAKVRFLCCTLDYDVTQGHLTVEHAYPREASPTPIALADVNLILTTIGGRLLEPGRWINIIGYVQEREIELQPQNQHRLKRQRSEHGLPKVETPCRVQAVLVWDAGTVKVEEYEKVMEAQKEAWRKTRHLRDASK